jgi:PAS domain S-box-containing protein
MIPPPVLPRESERLAALQRYAILRTPPEQAFDELARLASTVCGTPVALITLVDSGQQWFKARVGLDATHTAREVSFCGHAIAQDDLFVVPDARADPRFADNPLVQFEPRIRFYAGAPLTTADGHNLGTLCVIDRKPRVLTADQHTALRALARQVMGQLELRERERRLQGVNRFFDLTLDLLCIASFDGRFTRLNPAFEEVLGYSVGELTSQPFVDFVHPDDRAKTLAEVSSLREGRTSLHFENRYLHRDGSIRWIAWTASPEPEEQRIYAAGRDITRAKSAELELRRSETRIRSILDNALAAIVTTDARGLIETVNPAAERLFGHSARELAGRSLDVLLESGSLAELSDAALGRITEWRGRRRNGESFPCELSLFEFTSLGDERRFAAHMLDVSERHEVEKLKRDFISTVSHELRTPLTSIRGSLGLLSAGVMGDLPADARPMVTVAERNSMRLLALIDDILDSDRLESGQLEMDLQPTALLPILERSIESVSALAMQDGVEIRLECPHTTVMADPARIAQVAVNLLSNAVKYSYRGATVVMRAQVQDGWVDVAVEDRGRGIALELQKKLFRRFQRADSSDSRMKPGTGLGLSICKAIVERHGGSIGLESREGEGSIFWFRIPAGRDYPRAQEPA